MIAQIKEQLLGYGKVAGIEAILQQEGIVYNLVILEKVKNKIVLVQKSEGIKNIEELSTLVSSDIPVSLYIQGRGIINRKLAEGTYKSEMEVLSLILPNSNPDDFYIQQLPFSKYIFVSVARKNIINDIVTQISAKGSSVINLTLGPFGISNLIPFIGDKNEIIVNGTTLKIDNGELIDFTANTTNSGELLIGEDEIKIIFIPAYSSALTLFLPLNQDLLKVSSVHMQKEEFNNKNLFKVLGYSILIFFVVTLLINYIFYSYFKNENVELSQIASSYQNTLDEVKRLEKKIEEKEYFMKKAGWLSVPKTSFYSDEIAASIPGSSIRLTSIKVNPLNDKISKRLKKEVFKSDTILVEGTCNQPTALNPWMNELKKKNWVKSLSNLNYSYDQKTRSGNFEIEIRVGDDR